MAERSSKKNVSPSGVPPRWGFFLLVASLLLNAHFLFNKPAGKADEVLATADGASFRWKDISPSHQTQMARLDTSYYTLLKTEAEQWVSDRILAKEAARLKTTPAALLKEQVQDKAVVRPEEAMARYAASPTADSLPWPDALKQIENELKAQRARDLKRQLVEPLYKKYAVEFKLKPPASYQPELFSESRFPVYRAPTDPRIPARGSADAPVTLEVFSDFMCPYSKRFSTTLTELEKQYPKELRVLFRHFPLPMHAGSEVLHQASACAQDQGKFWEFHDRLMASPVKPEKEALSALAAELGLDAASFNACVDSKKYKGWVESEIAAGRAMGASGTPSFFVNGRLSVGAMPPEQVKKFIDWYLKPTGRYPGAKAPAPAAGNAGARPPSQPPAPVQVSVPPDWLKKGPSKGPADAPVTVVEALDYNCPFCKKGSATMEELFAKYPGKIRLVPKNHPLPMHPNAFKTSEAMMCAQEQGKYWEMRSELFGDSWGKQLPEDLKAAAQKAGLNAATFGACLDSSKTKAVVEEDLQLSTSLGVTGTPGYFVNGLRITGAQPLATFEKAVDEKARRFQEMNFEELVKRLKKIPFDEIRRETKGYFECVVSTHYLIHLYPILESYYGVPFKPAGIQPTEKAVDITKNYGGIQQQQTLYYKNTEGLLDCAMLWPWNDGTRSTLKIAQGIIEE